MTRKSTLAIARYSGIILVGIQLVGCGCSTTDRVLTEEVHSKISEIKNADANTRKLSDVNSQALVGLINETEEQRNLLFEQGREYLQFRQRKISLAKQRAMIASCVKDPDANPFCALIDKAGAEKRRAKRKPRLSASAIRQITKDLTAARLEKLKDFGESHLISALKKINDLERLDKVSEAVINHETCISTALATTLGLKAEMGLPEQKYKDRAIKLYEKALSCESTDQSTYRSAFRLGLLRIWNGQFAEADVALSKISETTDANDYGLRAVYWRMHCAQRLKNSKLERHMKERLVREFPLSLHALIAAGDAVMKKQIIEREEPMAHFRSALRPDLNSSVRAAEAMLALGSQTSSLELLKPMLNDALEAEHGFALYISSLLMRSGDNLNKFSLIASIFRKDPTLIARSTLEMLYPLKRLDIVKTQPSAVDPFLILSLIRQESAFNERAHSRAGAMGLMQLMPGTARRIARVARHRLFDPETNVKIGVRYFSNLVERFDGDVELALAAYNAGVLRVDEWLKRYPVDNRFLFLDLIPFKETREYVASIARNYYWYLKLYAEQGAKPAEAKEGATQASLRSITGVLKVASDEDGDI